MNYLEQVMSGMPIVAENSAVESATSGATSLPLTTPPMVVPATNELAPAEIAPDSSQQRATLHLPIDLRSASTVLIALIVCLYAMKWAQEVLVPILCGLMMSYALTPIVDVMARWKLPRPLGATLLLSAILALMGYGAWALGDQTDALIDTVPTVAAKVREMSQRASEKTSTIVRMQKAATELAAAAGTADPASAAASKPGAAVARATANPDRQAARPAAQSASESPASSIDVRGYLLSSTLGVMAFLGKIAVIFFVALFLMSSGNSFRRKMVKLAGPRLSQKKVTIETLDDITAQIQRYLLVQVGVSVVVGLCTWLAFLALGLNNSGVWGVVAAVTNLIPYAGAVIVGGGAAVVALVQFGTAEMAVIVGAASFAIHTIVGNVLTPWWMGRASKMSPVAVFVAVLVFGWLWGVWGLLLGVPILLVVKSVCDRIEDFKPIGELLGT